MECLPQDLCDIVYDYKKSMDSVLKNLKIYKSRTRFFLEGWKQQYEIFINMFFYFMDLSDKGVSEHTLYFLDHHQIPDHDLHWAADKLRPYYYYHRRDDILQYSEMIEELIVEILQDLDEGTLPHYKKWIRLRRWLCNYQQVGYLDLPSMAFQPIPVPPAPPLEPG